MGHKFKTDILPILRSMVGESASAFADAELFKCYQQAMLSIQGELFVPLAPSTIDVTTGTNKYNVPVNFAYIDEVRNSSDARIPDYAWELGMGTTPVIVFRPPFFVPTTAADPSIYGGQLPPVPTDATDDTERDTVDLGYLVYRALANAHSSLGGRGSQKTQWHQAEHTKLMELAEKRLENEVLMAKYRPKAWARLVPGRIAD